MSLKSKIEAVIYASEEPVTLAQLVGALGGEAQAELDALAAEQANLFVQGGFVQGGGDREVVEAGTREPDELDAAVAEALEHVEAGSSVALTVEPAAETPSETVEVDAAAELTSDGGEPSGAAESGEAAPEVPTDGDKKLQRERERAVREHIRRTVEALMREYAESDRGIEVREVASGYRMGTKPEYHDAVRGFVKSLKPAQKLSLPALETLAVVAYKQPVTAAEISEIRGVDSAGVLGGLMARKLIATAGRKQVIGRPMLYKTTKEFLLRFGLKDLQELPTPEEFESMAGELAEQEDLPMESTDAIVERANARGDAQMLKEDEQQHADAVVASEQDEEATAESAAGGDVHEEASEQVEGSGDAGEERGGEEQGDHDAEEERAAG